MDFDDYKFFSSVYNKIDIDTLEGKNNKFKKMLNILVDYSSYDSKIVDDFIILMEFEHGSIYEPLKTILSDKYINALSIIHEYYKIKYNEIITFELLDLIIKLGQVYFKTTSLPIINNARIFVLTLKSKSDNLDISTTAKVQLIKFKREEKTVKETAKESMRKRGYTRLQQDRW